MSLDLDRSTWQRVKFGDVVRNVNEYFDPARDGEMPYVAGPHIDSSSALVSRWGLTSDDDFPPTFKRIFQPGDVLLHSRGVEKIASVDRRGVTGEKLFVLRTIDPEQLDQRFLVWLLRSPQAATYYKANFSGSVNKFLNWTPLAALEFDLPPLADQRRIAELLWTFEAHATSLVEFDDTLQATINSFCQSVYRNHRNARMTPLSELASIRMGRQKAPKYMTGRHSTPFLSVANIGALELDLSDIAEMDFSEKDRETYKLLPGDILLTEGDLVSARNVGRPAVYRGVPATCCFQNTLIRLRFPDEVAPLFALAILEGMRLDGVFAAVASTTTVTHLGLKRISPVPFPLPNAEAQKRVASELKALLVARERSREQRATLQGVRAKFLGSVL